LTDENAVAEWRPIVAPVGRYDVAFLQFLRHLPLSVVSHGCYQQYLANVKVKVIGAHGHSSLLYDHVYLMAAGVEHNFSRTQVVSLVCFTRLSGGQD